MVTSKQYPRSFDQITESISITEKKREPLTYYSVGWKTSLIDKRVIFQTAVDTNLPKQRLKAIRLLKNHDLKSNEKKLVRQLANHEVDLKIRAAAQKLLG